VASLSATFSKCSLLAEVLFERGSALSTIGEEVFQECDALRSICVPRLVEVLQARCFRHCRRLSRVVFETDSHLRMILVAAFQSCESLVLVQLPKSVELLDNLCFGSCPNLIGISLESGSRLQRVSDSAFEPGHLEAISVPLSNADVFLPVGRIGSPFADHTSKSQGRYGIRGQWTVGGHPFDRVVSSIVVSEDHESDLVPSRFVPDEFEIGYLQALKDILMNRL
jgi:hypothetical protein